MLGSAVVRHSAPCTEREVSSADRKEFVAELERQHGERLRRFIASRLRHRSADIPDLVQEVYLRLLRMKQHETIRSSEAYLFTVAFHVLHEHFMRRAAVPEAVEITTLIDEMELASEMDPVTHAETQQELTELQSALTQLPAKAQAVLLLHRRDGYSLEQIAEQLGFSRANAAKYLAKSLLHCRQLMQQSRE